MATVKSFEDILAWQKARVLNEKVGSYIDSGRFKKSFRLIGQTEGSAGSIIDITLQKALNEVKIEGYCNFYIFLKALRRVSVTIVPGS